MKLRIFLICLLGFSSQAILWAEEFATVGFVKGKVSLLTAQDQAKLWKALRANDLIRPGDRIKTGNGSKVDLVYQESEIRIQQNSDFSLTEWDGKKKQAKATVHSGAAWFLVKGFSAGNFTVSTPTTTAGVRGTAFGVFYEPKEKTGYTCVCEGKVNINGVNFEQGFGASAKEGETTLVKNEYKDLITKEGATLQLKAKLPSMPMLGRCLACHKPVGWTSDSLQADEKYGK